MKKKSLTAFAETVLGVCEAQSSDGAAPTGEHRYAVRSLLGEGGMGRVMEAEDRQFARLVALKQLRPELAGAQGRFTLEARHRQSRTSWRPHRVRARHIGGRHFLLCDAPRARPNACASHP